VRHAAALSRAKRNAPDALFARIAAGSYDKPFLVEDRNSGPLLRTRRQHPKRDRLGDPEELVSAYTADRWAFLSRSPPQHLISARRWLAVKYCHSITETTSRVNRRRSHRLRTHFMFRPMILGWRRQRDVHDMSQPWERRSHTDVCSWMLSIDEESNAVVSHLFSTMPTSSLPRACSL